MPRSICARARVNVSEAVVSNAVRLDCAGNTSDTEALVLHLVVTSGHAGETFEAVALVNGKEYVFATVKAPADGGIPDGQNGGCRRGSYARP